MDLNSFPKLDSHVPGEGDVRAMQARYQLIVENATEGIWTLDAQNRTDYVNSRGAEILGYSPAELIGHSPVEYLLLEDRAAGEANLAVTARGAVSEGEFRLCRKDGSLCWVHYSTRPLLDASGAFVGSLGIFRDIAERKQAEDEIRRLNADLERRVAERTAELERRNAELTRVVDERQAIEQALLHAEQQAKDLIRYAPTAIYEIDFRGPRFTRVNDAMCQMSGYTREELLSMSPFALLDEESRKLFGERIRKTFAGEPIDTSVAYRAVVNGGREVYTVLQTRMMFEEGNPVGAFVIALDVTERKHAADALRASEERLRAIWASTSDAVVVTDPSGAGKVLSANPAACRLFGYTEEEFRQLDRQAMLDMSDPRVAALLQTRNQTGRGAAELVYKRKDGSLFTGELSTTLLVSQDGPRQAVAIIRDVTDRVRAEQALRASEEKYSLLFHAAAIPVALTNLPENTFADVNAAFEEVFGYTRVEALGKTSLELGIARPDENAETRAAIASSGAHRGVEKHVFTKSGEERIVLLNATAIEFGGKRYALSTMQDITERKRAEEEIQRLYQSLEIQTEELQVTNVRLEENAEELRMVNAQLEEHTAALEQANIRAEEALTEEQITRAEAQIGQSILNALMQYAPGVLIIADAPAVNIRMMSRYSESLFQRPMAELLGIPGPNHPFHRDLFMPDGVTPIPYHELPLVRAVTRGEAVLDHEMVVRHAQGDLVSVLSSAAPIRDTMGHVRGGIAVWSDITARKRAEEERARLHGEIERRATDLEMAYRELESFTYSVSHDLRTPLATIDSLAQMLMQDYGVKLPELERHLGLIRVGTQQMKDLIESLLNLSRLTRHTLHKERVNMSVLAAQALETLHRDPARNVTIDIKEMPGVQADPVLLRQVWVNLISNAVKFTRKCDAPRIEIGCAPADGEECVYYIRDNGVGFDMEQAERLFGVFQRLHSEEEYEGTGVGLAIVQRIIRRHGGRVWAEGEEGKGATFYFTLE